MKTRMVCVLLFLSCSIAQGQVSHSLTLLDTDKRGGVNAESLYSRSERQKAERESNVDNNELRPSSAFGGTGIMFSRINSSFTVLTGGRGSATFANRFSIGGGGWGTPQGILINTHSSDTLMFFKFGYGGIELGYMFYEGKSIHLGSSLLIGGGASFQETIPKKGVDSKMFAVSEPSIYTQITLGNLLRINLGFTYRIVTAKKFEFLDNKQLRGPSMYIAFLVGECECNQ